MMIGVVAIFSALIVIGGELSHTEHDKTGVVQAAAKRVLDIRQLFEDTFR